MNNLMMNANNMMWNTFFINTNSIGMTLSSGYGPPIMNATAELGTANRTYNAVSLTILL